MDVSRAVKENNDITCMNEPGMSCVDGTTPTAQSSITTYSVQKAVVENASVLITGQKLDSSHPLILRNKTLTYNMMAFLGERPSLIVGPGPKSPSRKTPDVLPTIVLRSHSPIQEVPINVSKSRTVRFHKLFKSTPDEEYPIESFSCAFKGDILLHGQMYVSHKWVCFYSKIKARGRLIEIPFDKIISITREKLALIIPNAIGIQTAEQKYVFGSFISRDSTYKKLVTIWKVNQDAIIGSLGVDLDITDGVLGNSNSGDITESDTTEDDLNADEQLGRMLSGGICKADVEVIRHPEPSPGIQQTGLSCKTAFKTFCSFSLKLQKIPRTNMLLAICTILVFFLMVSAIGLTYKILLLQSRLEMRGVWSPQLSVSFRDRAMSNLYWLQTESHASVVRQLHSVLEANIHLLEEVHLLLRSLYREPSKGTSICSKDEK